MRTLTILRHAKATSKETELPDFERPLASRGRDDAPVMGRHMREIGLAPDLVLCSPSVRTRETARLALAELGERVPSTTYDGSIYEATVEELVKALRALPPAVAHVLLIGHNPSLQDLILSLTAGRLDGTHAAIAQKLPTGALVVVELAIEDWAQIKRGCGTVRHFATPRQLRTE